MGYFFLAISVIGCILCLFWILRAQNSKDRGYGVFSMCGCTVVLLISIFVVSFSNDILFFSQKQEAIDATINIGETDAEKSSILFLFSNSINNSMTSYDIETLLGSNYIENFYTGSYSMRYPTHNYTLNTVNSDYIFTYFNKSGPNGKIRSIAWQYEKSDRQLYDELLEYLSTILGQPEKQNISSLGTLTADWPGFHLECNEFRVSFSRVFR